MHRQWALYATLLAIAVAAGAQEAPEVTREAVFDLLLAADSRGDSGSRDAFKALAALGKEAAPHLKEALQDEMLDITSHAAAAVLLLHLGDDSGMPVLEELMKDGPTQEMNVAVGRMGMLKDKAFLPLIETALERPDAQQGVVYAAAFCGGKDALPAVKAALDHPDEGVRYGARVWFENLLGLDDVDLLAKEWAEDDGTRLREIPVEDIFRIQVARLERPRGGDRRTPRKRYLTRPLSCDDDAEEIAGLLALAKQAGPKREYPAGTSMEPHITNRSLVVQPWEGEPFEILYADSFHAPFGNYHSAGLKEALFALGGGRSGVSIIHVQDGQVREVLNGHAIAPHTGSSASGRMSIAMHLTPERGLTLHVVVREGRKTLMEGEEPARYGQAVVYESPGPGMYIVLLHKP